MESTYKESTIHKLKHYEPCKLFFDFVINMNSKGLYLMVVSVSVNYNYGNFTHVEKACWPFAF